MCKYKNVPFVSLKSVHKRIEDKAKEERRISLSKESEKENKER